MEISFQENYFWKRSSRVFYATKVSHAFFVNPSLRGFCKPLSQFCTPGWGITTLLWSWQPSLSPFSLSLLIRGFRDFAPRLTCPLTMCHFIPVWLARSGCLFFLRLLRAYACYCMLHLTGLRGDRYGWLLSHRSPSRTTFFLSDLGVYLLDLPSLTFSGTPRVKSVYHITLSKGTVFLLALPLWQLRRACQTG